MRRTSLSAPVLLALASLAAAPLRTSAAACVGDCPPGDGAVVINELVIGVSVALDRQALDACPSFDANGDGAVAVAELITAVNNAQLGCGVATTPTGAPGTLTNTPTPTVTPTPAAGPQIVFFGVTSADDTVQRPTATDPGGIPIYQRNFGLGFSLVVEAQPGSSGRGPGSNAYAPGGVPDLQIQATRALGNGSTAVCDNAPPIFGGVPAIDPPRLEDPDAIGDALNDFGCRFQDGTGQPTGRRCGTGCVRFDDGESGCLSGDSGNTVQYCGQITMAIEFPTGDTLVTARVRDVTGELGPPARLILRVGP